jgi:adenylate cyclase
MNYSVLGDTVNLASRLESLGKTYGVDLVVGEATAALLGDTPLVELDLVAVKGKAQAVRIFTVLPDAAPPAPEHDRMIAAYRHRDWDGALAILGGGAELMPMLRGCYELYRHRIEEFMSAPPPEDWDGVYVAKEK